LSRSADDEQANSVASGLSQQEARNDKDAAHYSTHHIGGWRCRLLWRRVMISLYHHWQAIKRPAFICASGLLLSLNLAIVGLIEIELANIQPRYSLLEQIRDNTRSLLVGLLNAEVGVRGYIITGDSVYLTPYQAGSLEILDQIKTLQQLPLSEPQRYAADQLTSKLNAQMQTLAGMIDLRQTSGQSAADIQLGNGKEKIGLDALRASISNRIDSLSTSMLALQRDGKTYQTVETYCFIFAAFWLYMVVFISAHRPA
jgi:CHASE3 domain sensor protein